MESTATARFQSTAIAISSTVLLISSTFMYLLEAEYQPEAFGSIIRSTWWAAAALTTVGYGDMYPTSFEGKMIATLTMMVGVLALALPVSVIGANFADIYGKKQKQTLQNISKQWGTFISHFRQYSNTLDLQTV